MPWSRPWAPPAEPSPLGAAPCPCCRGLRLELHGDQLRVTGSDLDLTISVRAAVSGDGDGTAVVPAKLLVRHRPGARRPARSPSRSTTTRPASRSGRSQFAVRTIPADEFPQLPEPADELGDASTPWPSPTRCARSCRPPRTTSPARSSPACCMAAEGDGLRLVATDSYRLAVRDLPGTSVLAEGQQVLVPSTALKELARLLSATPSESRCASASATSRSRSATSGSPRRLIEGEFPNYRGLIPSGHPNRLTRRPRGRCSRPCAACACWPREATPGPPGA